MLPHTATLGHHGVNVHGTESRNKSMIVHIDTHEDKKIEDVANELVGKKTYIGWPFLQEGMVVAWSNTVVRQASVTSLIRLV
jgi:5'-3' exoribonuclease 1